MSYGAWLKWFKLATLEERPIRGDLDETFKEVGGCVRVKGLKRNSNNPSPRWIILKSLGNFNILILFGTFFQIRIRIVGIFPLILGWRF